MIFIIISLLFTPSKILSLLSCVIMLENILTNYIAQRLAVYSATERLLNSGLSVILHLFLNRMHSILWCCFNTNSSSFITGTSASVSPQILTSFPLHYNIIHDKFHQLTIHILPFPHSSARSFKNIICVLLSMLIIIREY